MIAVTAAQTVEKPKMFPRLARSLTVLNDEVTGTGIGVGAHVGYLTAHCRCRSVPRCRFRFASWVVTPAWRHHHQSPATGGGSRTTCFPPRSSPRASVVSAVPPDAGHCRQRGRHRYADKGASGADVHRPPRADAIKPSGIAT